ncbi:MAG: tetratricopeptide repeat protein [Alphaproteobacteria bacterium]|nr:tetratricopeptide repeat protein [Alphaproteobacteria bacterium]
MPPEHGSSDLTAAQTALDRGEVAAAVAALNALLSEQPDHVEGLTLMAQCAHRTGHDGPAVGLLERAAAVAPERADIRFSLGAILSALGRKQEARDQLARAVGLQPDLAEAWVALGNIDRAAGALEQAAQAYEQALRHRPELIEVETNLGVIRQAQTRHDEALRRHRSALAAKPDFALAAHNLLMGMHYSDAFSAAEISQAHFDWAKRRADPLTAAAPPIPSRPADNARLRIGYVSPDFRNHPVGRFVAPLIEQHDASAFRVFCYATGRHDDAVTRRIRRAASDWIEAAIMSDDALAARIRADRIDLLIDLAGHTAGARLLCFARRPAPVQASWLGYPNTTGLTAMDYRISDAIADPDDRETEALCSETLVRLEGGFLCYEPPVPAPSPGPAPAARPDRPVTFGSFNNLAKLNPSVIALWSRTLAATPGSRLLLKAQSLNDPATVASIRADFAAYGVAPDRLDLMGASDTLEEHFARYGLIDVALDTFPYNGTTTTFDALWAGRPVVALAGDRHAARVGQSILTHLGRADWIAQSADDYVAIASRLAAGAEAFDPQDLLRSPYGDAAGFARKMEAAYREMIASSA